MSENDLFEDYNSEDRQKTDFQENNNPTEDCGEIDNAENFATSDIPDNTPDFPHLTQKEIADLFEPHIFKRAESYAFAGRVHDLENIAPDLWHATVDGTTPYEVDIRIHHGTVVSAACTCPYGQRHSYCKHVGATLLTLLWKQNDPLNHPPISASNIVRWFWYNQSKLRAHLNDDDWKAIRSIFEHLYDFNDIARYLLRVSTDRLGIYKFEKNRPAQNINDSAFVKQPLDCKTIADLPHGWLTILEAAYEHLHDTEGLRRLYSLYILLATDERDIQYVDILRRLSGDHWQEDVTTIVHLALHSRGDLFRKVDDPALEYLFHKEHLVEAAKKYCFLHDDDPRALRLFDLLVEGATEMEIDRLLRPLQRPDSDIYRAGDAVTIAYNVCAWLDRITELCSPAKAGEIAAWITDMFPNRTLLLDRIHGYITEEPTIEEA